MKTEDYRKSLFKRSKDPDYAVGCLTDVLANESQGAFLIALRDVLLLSGLGKKFTTEPGGHGD